MATLAFGFACSPAEALHRLQADAGGLLPVSSAGGAAGGTGGTTLDAGASGGPDGGGGGSGGVTGIGGAGGDADAAVDTAGPGGTGGVDAGRDAVVARDAEGDVMDAPAEPKPTLLFDPASFYSIQPVNGNGTLAVDINANAQVNGTIVWQYTAGANNHAQQFVITDVGGGAWHIAMRDNPAKCIETAPGDLGDSAKVRLWDCNGDVGERWMIMPDTAPNTFQLRNAASGRYLDEPSSMTTNMLQLQVFMQNQSPAQKWVIKTPPP